MVVGQSFKQYFKQEIVLDLASSQHLSKSVQILPQTSPEKSIWIKDGDFFILETNHTKVFVI